MLKLIGSYGVILDERHYKELLMQHVIPPVAKVHLHKLIIFPLFLYLDCSQSPIFL